MRKILGMSKPIALEASDLDEVQAIPNDDLNELIAEATRYIKFLMSIRDHEPEAGDWMVHAMLQRDVYVTELQRRAVGGTT